MDVSRKSLCYGYLFFLSPLSRVSRLPLIPTRSRTFRLSRKSITWCCGHKCLPEISTLMDVSFLSHLSLASVDSHPLLHTACHIICLMHQWHGAMACKRKCVFERERGNETLIVSVRACTVCVSMGALSLLPRSDTFNRQVIDSSWPGPLPKG